MFSPIFKYMKIKLTIWEIDTVYRVHDLLIIEQGHLIRLCPETSSV